MHLVIDAQALQSPASRGRGIGRYAANLISALAEARPGWHIELIENSYLTAVPRTGLPVRRFQPPLSDKPGHRDANERYYADWLCDRQPEAILLTTSFDRHALLPQFTRPRPRLLSVLYDLIPLIFHGHYLHDPRERADHASRLRRLVQSDGVLAISRATALDFTTLVPGPLPDVVTIGAAADACFAPIPALELSTLRQTVARKFELRRDFLLYVGGFDYRKNLVGAMQAFAILPAECRARLDLLITCRLSAPQRACLEEFAVRLGIAASVRLTGHVDDEDLRALYQTCRLFFFPSLYEGFGLPILEAMHCGAPIVASNTSSIPEVVGDLGWLADPRSSEKLAAAIQRALAQPREHGAAARIARAERFTWETTAALAARSLEWVRPSNPPLATRRRIAWASPLPPAASGISDYSADVLGPLSERYDIELVVDPDEPLVSHDLASRHTVVVGDELPSRHEARPYDLFVYQVGNSHYHAYMVDLMRRFRGLVVLHDFYLGGLVVGAVASKTWQLPLAKELEWEGAADIAAALEARRIDDLEAIGRVPLNRRVLALAGAVLVHSSWSWRRVRALVDVPVARVRQAVRLPRVGSPREERQRLRLPAEAFIVATLGFIGPTKRVPSILHAVAALPAPLRERTLVLVIGHVTSEYERRLHEQAHVLGLGDSVRLLGRVPMKDFTGYARAADVCVQLRYPTRGETSAALLREMAAGAACVVSDAGSIAEVPDDVVCKVRTPEHEVTDLTAALRRLADGAGERARLGAAARRHIERNHSLRQLADGYSGMIELAALNRRRQDSLWLEAACDALASCEHAVAARDCIRRWSALRAGRGASRLLARPEHSTSARPAQTLSAQGLLT
jgi:glycosyltransferase involved in cell wall biosynthesis